MSWQPIRKIGAYTEVRCECGLVKNVLTQDLKSGKSRMCRKCSAKTNNPRKSLGLAETPIYNTWIHIKQRTGNPNNKDYKWYGGRGIKMCERWHNSFANFYADMGERPSAKYSIDRINNDGNYEPGNCRWATKAEQSANTSQVIKWDQGFKGKAVELMGKGYTQGQIAYLFNVSRPTVNKLINSEERIVV